jgi:hypothetical protein
MPHAGISCVHPGLKTILVHEAASHIKDDRERRIFVELVNSVADCQGTLLGLVAASGATRSKRAPSAYNLHMKKCASSKAKGGEGKEFKACAVEWRAAKLQKK